ncbi:MAG TPA: hypothetical protein VK205_09535 [Prolixibacteraceae bacterium]|nr:hypothetical protein [Prolixibacteraceae bacterium]
MKASVIALHWLPRVICILGILFISKYAIDSIESYLTLWQQILTLMLHLVPCVILAALLVIAWKWELAGGILFTVIGLALTPVIFKHNYNLNESIAMSLGIVTMITFPLVIIGNLFTFSYIKRRKYRLMMKALQQSRVQKIERYKLLKYNQFQNIRYYPPISKEEDKILQHMEGA